MDIERFITKEDFLKLKPYAEGGILMDGRRYAAISIHGKLSLENQLKNLGGVNMTGEGVMDRVFFFEVFRDPIKEFWNEAEGKIFQIVSAKVVDRYRYVSAQEAGKEVALIKAKIILADKKVIRKDEGSGINGKEEN